MFSTRDVYIKKAINCNLILMQDQYSNDKFEDLMFDYLSGDISENNEIKLFELLTSDSKYKASFSAMIKTKALSIIPLLEAEKNEKYFSLSQKLKLSIDIKESPKFLTSLVRIAAIFLFAVTTGISSYYLYQEFVHNLNNLRTCETLVPLGSQAKVILPDGTIAWLNSGSILKYTDSYGKNKREVNLTGEGYFEVEKDKSKPFLLHTNNIEIKVLGTIFNVRSYLDDPLVVVNLLEGKVDISLLNIENSKKLTLYPNEKMIYDKKSKIMLSCKVLANKSAQWVNGKLCFVDASMNDIVKDLERKFDVQISIDSQKITNEHFSGSLNLNQPLNEILNYIDVDKKFLIKYNGKKIIIKNK